MDLRCLKLIAILYFTALGYAHRDINSAPAYRFRIGKGVVLFSLFACFCIHCSRPVGRLNKVATRLYTFRLMDALVAFFGACLLLRVRILCNTFAS
jgi:hypothetical protein